MNLNTYAGLLWAKVAILNSCAFAVLGLAWQRGYLTRVIETDTSNICLTIFLVFLCSLTCCFYEVARLVQEFHLTELSRHGTPNGHLAHYAVSLRRNPNGATESLQLHFFSRITYLRFVAGVLTTLGLVGTVVGFIIALSSVDAAAVKNADYVQRLVGALLQGGGIALYTTLVGGVLSIWLLCNYQILSTATARVVAQIIDVAIGENQSPSG